MLLRLLILVIQLKWQTITQRLVKLKKKQNKLDHDHGKYITTPEFIKLTSERLKE